MWRGRGCFISGRAEIMDLLGESVGSYDYYHVTDAGNLKVVKYPVLPV